LLRIEGGNASSRSCVQHYIGRGSGLIGSNGRPAYVIALLFIVVFVMPLPARSDLQACVRKARGVDLHPVRTSCSQHVVHEGLVRLSGPMVAIHAVLPRSPQAFAAAQHTPACLSTSRVAQALAMKWRQGSTYYRWWVQVNPCSPRLKCSSGRGRMRRERFILRPGPLHAPRAKQNQIGPALQI
jgi:hypothetical protein